MREATIRLATVCALLSLGGSARAQAQERPNALTEDEVAAGWKLLFDGRTTEGWRVYGESAMSEGWQVVEGELTRVARGGDIVTTEVFDNFELSLEFKLGPRGNSGIFFHAAEGSGRIYYVAPEMQLLDDALHPDGRAPLTSNGANYALHAPASDASKPIGEWNRARLRVEEGRVEHWLNGVKIVEYRLWDDDWSRRVAESKFSAWPEYGLARRGPVGLQDHGDRVAFRSIKIRPLDGR